MMGTLLQTVPCIFLFILIFGSPPLPSAVATPIGVPNFHKCELASDTSVVGPVTHLQLNCCLPIPTQSIKKFSFSRYKSEKHVRQAAHTVSKDYIAKYNRAYALMKALPDEDPRSFHTQANIHCAFCNFAYRQKGNSSVPLQVHFSWLFLTWHRWYIYFHERILQSLLGDPTFSLVFWNWDDQETGGNVMPAMFVQNNTAIYDANRNQAHLPPAIVSLVATSTSNVTSVIINENLNAMYQGVVTADTAELFMGGRYVTGTNDASSTVLDAPLGGSLENGVHNAIHFWTGNPLLPLFQDMGTFSTAARDPIFFAHHSNVDRLWDVWRYKLPGGPREDHTDPDFLDAEFAFYDEHGLLVKVNVRDSLDNDKLGISYPDVASDQQWITYTPNATTNSSAVPAAIALGVPFVGPYPENGTLSLGSRFPAIVHKPVSKSSTKSEILVVQGLRLIRDSFTAIRAFVNLPKADNTTAATSAEYLGDFNVIPAIGKHRALMTNVQFEIGSNLRRIGIDNETEVVITLVKIMGTSPVTFEGLRIKYA